MIAKSVEVSGWDEPSEPLLLPLSNVGCDEFERALLPIVRDLNMTCVNPDMGNWLPVYGRAEKLWGAQTGLPLVYGLSQIVVSLVRIKGEKLDILIASDAWAQGVTHHEQLLLLMIHHMRRGHTQAGCDFLLDLLDGEMDTKLMNEALAFARRHSCGTPLLHTHDGVVGNRLRAVD
ncbi:MAG: hypothetical protein AAGA50_09185 [Pseudomonadota bacterium]